MRHFHWLCATEIPAAWDLRRCGWHLTRPEPAAEPGESVALAHVAGMDEHAWSQLHRSYPRPRHDRVLLLGVADSGERARLLGLGFGDVLGEAPALTEVEARAARVAGHAQMLPGRRAIGPLRLDLLTRDGIVANRPLALHPREFALLWRLADSPGQPVGKRTLLREVWRLGHVPDTNSLAVHIFRLRAKLAAAGLRDLVRTAPGGGYMLAVAGEAETAAVPMAIIDRRWHDLIVGSPDGIAIGDHGP
ncbi:winged helix-turn-helix domain-containing protein [Novosphingobium sp. JCM 18896]|uniref:winged helix-turn-helix domain-containing protein n=1 Tax=Novosphingobium sp. JCM 18896 TaxID=2989731 RepID=UPI002221C24C|nr:winged helix-turn-helix domain-containing protein [Novosphingobium sp. JCM 18896]